MAIDTDQCERDLIATAWMAKDKVVQKEVLATVTADMFKSTTCRKVWRAMQELSNENEILDLTTIPGRAGGDYLGWLVQITQDSVTVPSSIDVYAKRVKQASYYRKMINALQDSLEVAREFSDITNLAELSADIKKNMDSLTLETGAKEPRKFKEIAEEYVDVMNAKLNNDPDVRTIKTGIDDLDEMTGGFNLSDLILVGAPSGVGKTELVVKIIDNIALANQSALMFSLEMGDHQIVERSIAGNANLPANHLRTPQKLNEDGFQKMGVAIGALNKTNLFIQDKAGLTVDDICAQATRMKEKHPDLSVIVIDQLSLIKLSAAENRTIALGNVSGRLKQLAKDLSIPVVLLVQLNTKVIAARKPQDRRPMPSDIKDCSKVYEDADVCIFIYRPGIYDDNAPRVAELILGKARHAILGDKCYTGWNNGHFTPIEQHTAFNMMDAYEQSFKKHSNDKKFN